MAENCSVVRPQLSRVWVVRLRSRIFYVYVLARSSGAIAQCLVYLLQRGPISPSVPTGSQQLTTFQSDSLYFASLPEKNPVVLRINWLL